MLDQLTAAVQKLSPRLRKIIRNIGWLFADRILRLGVGVIVVALIARYLGPDQFGSLNYTIALVALFRIFATLGLERIAIRELVHTPAKKEEILGTVFILRLLGGTFTWLLAIGTIFLIRPDDTLSHYLVAIIAAGTIFEAFDTIDFWFQWQVKSKYTVLAKNTAFILVTGLRITLITIQAPVIFIALAILTETILGAIGLVIAYRFNRQALLAWRPKLARAKSLLQESWPLIIAGVAIMIYLRIDQVMLGQIVGYEAVGIYAVTTRISSIWYFIPVGIVSSVAPSITEAKRTSETLYYSRLQKLLNLMAVLAYAIAIPITFLAKPILVLMFGESYASGGRVLVVLVWTGIFWFLGICKSQIWIINEGRTKYNLIEKSLGAIVNILLNFWLIPLYQETGAAIATLISYAFVDYLMCFIYPPARVVGWAMTKALTLNFFISSKKI
ncbi:MAG: flippase [Symploca sp. SIO1B1]|nr:flippase [Symploca sp. SIO2D2]NER24556.1 flippase [Symploca sp. SIO1C2]NER98310.1 flippase [Symploca sp. SIO1B1]